MFKVDVFFLLAFSLAESISNGYSFSLSLYPSLATFSFAIYFPSGNNPETAIPFSFVVIVSTNSPFSFLISN